MGEDRSNRIIVVDTADQILGRVASRVAKMLLEGKKVYVVNAEKAVLSGEPKRVIDGYLRMFQVQTYRNPERQGIRRERSPRNIFKSAVKGMLPTDKPKGRQALKNLKVFVGFPEELKKFKTLKFSDADAAKLESKYVYVGQVSKRLGWRD